LAEEWYANHGVELVVDQRTGRVIYAQTGPKRTLRAPGADKDAAVLLDAEKISFTTATQREAVRQAEEDSGRLRMVGETRPVVAVVAGSVLALAGGRLVARGRKEEDLPDSTGTTDSPQPGLTKGHGVSFNKAGNCHIGEW